MRSAISPNDRRVAELVRRFDRDEQSVAETWRLVAAAAASSGMRRPSYQHVRRLVLFERRLRLLAAERRALLTDAAVLFATGRTPSITRLLLELQEVRQHEELVLQEHKRPSGAT